MTDEQCNHALTLVKGEHWHEGIMYDSGQVSIYKCSCMEHQSIEPLHRLNPDHLSNPYPYIQWMEIHMPEVWDAYLFWAEANNHGAHFIPFRSTVFNKQLNLRNLVQYLYEHPEWGNMMCCRCDGTGFIPHIDNGDYYEGEECQDCNGTGKITHPALVYLRTVKEKG